MNTQETERIIAFHGARRGVAHMRNSGAGMQITLTLRPGESGGVLVPKAACLAARDGTAVRIALAHGAGQTPVNMDPVVLLLIADTPEGEAFCAEGTRGALDRDALEALKRPLRALRATHAWRADGQKSGMQQADRDSRTVQENPPAPEDPPPEPAEDCGIPAEEAAAAQESPALPEAPATESSSAPLEEAPKLQAEKTAHIQEAAGAAAQAAVFPEAQSEALRSILSRASALFPPGGGDGSAAAHFASDAPLHGAFVPRPLAAREEQVYPNSVTPVRMEDCANMAEECDAVRAAPAGAADPQWSDAVRELSRPQEAPKPSGVGTAEQTESPFPKTFPGVVWRRVRYPGTRRYYLEGTGQVNGVRCTLYALPGESYPAQPYRARGFTRFVRDVNGNGYWVKVKRGGR